MFNRYYYENTHLETRYPTLWNGYLKYEKKINSVPLNVIDVDTILVDICDVNFYINIDDRNHGDYKIYLSLCRDTDYYYTQFEKHIKKVIAKLEDFFNITIIDVEFYGTEVKHMGNQYKYTISKTDGKIVLKKRTLNWAVLDKNSTIDSKINNLSLK